jgi:hypothetical protein
MKEGMVEGKTSPCCNGHHTVTGSAASSAYLSLIFRASGETMNRYHLATLPLRCHKKTARHDQN